MELENVLKLINAVSESSLTSFTMEDGDTKLSFGADRNAGNAAGIENMSDDIIKEKLNKSDRISGMAQEADNIHMNVSTAWEDSHTDGKTINSPLVGVFYSAASPDDKAYVSVGDKVKKGQVIGIVEAMKLMNEIESDYDGVVTDILVNNEDMVEYGQPMFVINPL